MTGPYGHAGQRTPEPELLEQRAFYSHTTAEPCVGIPQRHSPAKQPDMATPRPSQDWVFFNTPRQIGSEGVRLYPPEADCRADRFTLCYCENSALTCNDPHVNGERGHVPDRHNLNRM